MKKVYNKELDAYMLEPTTSLEAVESLFTFLTADLWYAIHAEMKTEEDMWKYLQQNFDICIGHIKRIEK